FRPLLRGSVLLLRADKGPNLVALLTKIVGNALTRYCRCWSRWRKAEEWIEQHGLVYPIKDDRGQVKCVQQWPLVAVAHKLCHELSRLEAEFGMTPSARTRIQVPVQPAPEDPSKSKFFKVGG